MEVKEMRSILRSRAMDELQISPADPHGVSPGKDQQAAGVGILLQIMMLVLSFILGHVLRRHRFYYLPEASASLLIGLIVGGLANISNTETSIRYLGGVMYLMYRLPLVECLMFGALISATDPVTVLSIFQELGTDMNLYALVFGESVLNDAMAISLYRTMSLVKNNSSGQNFFLIIVRFLETFVGSMSAGLDIDNLQNLECCLFVLFPYFSYMLAEGLGLSGIVSILFTGMVMKHYSFSNLSENSQKFVAAFFHLISSLAETFIFIGLARAANVFTCAYLLNLVRPAQRQIPLKHQKALWYSGLRGAMAFALALQSVHDLPEGHGQTIFTATTAIVVLTVLLIGGSTGTMLEALQVVGDTHEPHLNDVSVVVDIYTKSKSTRGELQNIISSRDKVKIEVLMIQFRGQGMQFARGDIFGTNGVGSFWYKPSFEANNGYVAPYDDGEESSSSGNRLKMRLKEFHRSSAASFRALDRNYLTPFFTTQAGDRDGNDDSHGANYKYESDYSLNSCVTTKGDFPSMNFFNVFYEIAPKRDWYSFRKRHKVKGHVDSVSSSFK
ncbi:hypothetical protein QVD17_19424 [Tagetes erecta]|uniref:Cation/H+ exchanger transmembrane domain-containing protein n=1 Tax=Tagetes erecta TaxID=13708 RepID=A0AAD8NQ21_TARER|nr:hypothetical protein QVD17_19424 [Tagetes erecta]